MIHLNNAGSAYEIGRHHGASCPGAIRLAYQAWARFPALTDAQVDGGLDVVRQRLARSFPENLEEMRGIAAGAARQTMAPSATAHLPDMVIHPSKSCPPNRTIIAVIIVDI